MKLTGIYHMPGSQYLWYRWSEDGRRYAISLKTSDLSEAVKQVEEIKAGRLAVRWEQQEANFITPATKVLEEYLSQAQKRKKKPMRPRTAGKKKAVLLKFLKDTGTNNVREITLPTIDGWLAKLNGKSDDTIHTYARDLKTFVKYLVEQRLVRGYDFEKFDVPERAATGRKNWIQNEEVDRIISSSKDPDLTFALYCGFHAGLRRSEIDNARVHWFDLTSRLMHVQNEPSVGFKLKDRENRAVKLSSSFTEFLRGYLTGGPKDFALRPEKAPGKNDYRYDFRRPWESHMKRCGVTCTIHDARRSFASNLVSAGVSIYIVAKWLGDGVQVVERSYGHLAPSAGDIDVLSVS